MRSRYITALVLALALLFVYVIPLQAAGTGITVSSGSGALGQQTDIAISVANPSGMTGGSFNLYYDPDILKPVNVTSGDILKNSLLESNLNFQGSQGQAVRVVWAGSRGIQNAGLLCSVSFKLLQNGTSSLDLGQVELFDNSLHVIDSILTGGTMIAGTGQKVASPPPAVLAIQTEEVDDFNTGASTATGSNSNNYSTQDSAVTGSTELTCDSSSNPAAGDTQAPAQNLIMNPDEIPSFTGGAINLPESNSKQAEVKNSYQQIPEQQPNPEPQASRVQSAAAGKATSNQQPGSVSLLENSLTARPVFNDTAQHWARTYIEELAEAQIMLGYKDGSFHPDQNISRAELARVLALAMKLPLKQDARLSFRDREQVGDWARASIAAAFEAGIISGYSDGSFQPARNVTRTEMAVMLARTRKAEAESEKMLTFADSGQIPEWARSYVASAVKNGIISGKENNRFDPLGLATRAEAACMVCKLIDNI